MSKRKFHEYFDMARKTIKPSPDEVVLLRKKIGLTQKEAAASVYIPLRQWQKFEQTNDGNSKTSTFMPDAILELFCIKHGLPFPFVRGKQVNFGKLVSFAGGAGGLGRSSLTLEMAIMLSNDGYSVIVVTDKWGQLESARKRFYANNAAFPRVMTTEDIKIPELESEYKTLINAENYLNGVDKTDSDRDPYFSSDINLSDLQSEYDFVFLDLEEREINQDRITKVPLDLIITPARIRDRLLGSVKSARRFKRTKHNKTTNALLILNADTPYVHQYEEVQDLLVPEFSPYREVGDSSDCKYYEVLNECDQFYFGLEKEDMRLISEAENEGIYIFDTITNGGYDFADSNIDTDKFFHARLVSTDQKDTVIARQMISVKNEILRLLRVPYLSKD